jgi:hypothetical protein
MRMSEERQSESLLRSHTERASYTAQFAAAREKCRHNASKFRSEKAHELWLQHIARTAMEEERKSELKRSAQEKQLAHEEERTRRFQVKEASVARLRKADEARAAELAKIVESRQEAAAIRRRQLIEAVYEHD